MATYRYSIDEFRALLAERAERVRACKARIDTSNMTRAPRDPEERALLEAIGERLPFTEVARSVEGDAEPTR